VITRRLIEVAVSTARSNGIAVEQACQSEPHSRILRSAC